MAILANMNTVYGEARELYIRVNSLTASNHNITSYALFRGYVSETAFRAGGAFLWEQEVGFVADVSRPLWEQAYTALKLLPGLEGAIDLQGEYYVQGSEHQ